MNGSACKLLKYMEGTDKRFIVPIYQRNYNWKIENCKQLFDDLVKVIQDNRENHFFGSIVSVYDDTGKNEEFLIIDGQQRLTTVSLLLLAMYNLISNRVIFPKNEHLKQRIYEDFLVDKYEPKEKRIKLKPIKNDQQAFNRLFGDSDEYVRNSNLTINYDYFYKRIQKQEITIDELFNAIRSLEIINIKLNHEDDPQLIFESLNSTGVDLSEGDKIRNFILMGLPQKKQEEYYDNYWNRIEEYTKYNVSLFVRDYLSIKQLSIPPQKKIYIAFKEYAHSYQTKELLEDLLNYARRYGLLLGNSFKNYKIDSCIYRLNRLETTVTRPFFLEVLRMYDEGKLNIDEITEIFLITENYITRRLICDLPTNSLNKIFLILHREIVKYDGADTNYLEKFKYAIRSKTQNARFPSDNEFKSRFSEKQVYQMNSKNKVYLLERFENFGTAETKNVFEKVDQGVYSIEHIMPQHLTPTWIKELGKHYNEIHETWLHRIANLTLTAYNSKYSNSTFEEKKDMEHGFLDSGIRMNTYIARNDTWTLNELEERNKHLMRQALKIWALPVTSFKPDKKLLDSCILDEDIDLTSRKIVKFSYKNIEQPVKNWAEMLQKVLQILYSDDKSIITKLAISSEDNIATQFAINQSDFSGRASAEIKDGIYVLTNTNTRTKIFVLKKVFQLYDLDCSDLVFYLRNESSEK